MKKASKSKFNTLLSREVLPPRKINRVSDERFANRIIMAYCEPSLSSLGASVDSRKFKEVKLSHRRSPR